ncbi:MFS transporter [Streptomyces sp. NPDC057052]|uniref:MFS transporter n=1 Tax=Streptomyces sp. NPDC057052 TaxID=3346010 RepID=UPI003630F350
MPLRPASTSLFAQNRVFRNFWLSRTLSLVGDGVTTTALLLFVGERNGPNGVAFVMLASALPRFFGPVAGALADRFPLRRLIVVSELVQAVLWAVIALWLPPLWPLALLVLVATWFATVVATAGRVVIVRAVDDADRPRANAWIGTAFNARTVAGPVIGGLLVEFAGPRQAFGINVVTFLLGAVLLIGLPVMLAASATSKGMPGFLTDIADGLRFARGNPFVRSTSLLLLLGVLFGSLDNVALVFLAEDDLRTGPGGYGLLSAAFGVAMVAVSLLLTQRPDRLSPTVLMLGGWAVTGVGLMLTGAAPWLGLAIAFQGVAGFGNGGAMIGEDTLLQRHVPQEMLGKIGGLLTSAAFLGSVGAYAVGGLLIDLLSARPVLVISGAGLVLVTALSVRGVLTATRETSAEGAGTGDGERRTPEEGPAEEEEGSDRRSPGEKAESSFERNR